MSRRPTPLVQALAAEILSGGLAEQVAKALLPVLARSGTLSGAGVSSHLEAPWRDDDPQTESSAGTTNRVGPTPEGDGSSMSEAVSEAPGGSVGLSLCAACYEAAGMENEHSDGHHDDEPNPKCKECKEAQAQIDAATRRDERRAGCKPGPGRLIRVREGDPAWARWPQWDHPLGGIGCWAVVLRPLRQGVEAAPLVDGYTLTPRGVRAFQTIEDHREVQHGRYERAVKAHEIARSSGLYTEAQLGEPPTYPAWLARPLPRKIARPET